MKLVANFPNSLVLILKQYFVHIEIILHIFPKQLVYMKFLFDRNLKLTTKPVNQ